MPDPQTTAGDLRASEPGRPARPAGWVRNLTRALGLLGACAVTVAMFVWAFPTVTFVSKPLTPSSVLGDPPAGGQPIIVRDGPHASMCSLGVPWRTADGAAAWVTAGHCGPNGSVAYLTMRPIREDVLGVLGGPRTVDTDASLVFPRAAPDRATQAPSLLGKYEVVAARAPVRGETVCLAGVSTGMSCGWRVWETDGRFRLEDGAEVSAAAVVGWSARCVSQGDSGGPVFALDNGRAVVVGIITASSRPTLPGVLPAGPCSVLVTPMNRIVEQLGGRPRTAF